MYVPEPRVFVVQKYEISHPEGSYKRSIISDEPNPRNYGAVKLDQLFLQGSSSTRQPEGISAERCSTPKQDDGVKNPATCEKGE
ncbi:Hypothetical protein NTJ_04314 [Nesidiocoris tenuis]|uniref:Uncharacterized protein n=1 Tax=Nesidiocoris tenuis TaxID=355587 RepID=A0ABN7AGW2_9HEMI|nr:Hypothetical protein NTJ_04314 [Nesidiocoris tenuis]